MSGSQLEPVFRQLDYLDDGFEDGLVSHVGLRRIILETPELEEEIGSTLTRALLARAEQNLYGRLSWEDFYLLAQEVYQYQQRQIMAAAAAANTATGGGGGGGGYQVPAIPDRKSTKRQVHNAAVKLAIPESERDVRMSYLEEYSCKPPPLFLILISMAQIGVFVWHVIILGKQGHSVGPNGPPYISGKLIFNPNKKEEIWRFFTYMFVHSGYFHITFNILIQLILGIPLEMVHRWWRILLIYVCGGIAGSLATSVTDPNAYLAGASGGVYAIISAHLANVMFNWSEMEFPGLRLTLFLLLTGVDTGVAIYYRYTDTVTQIGYVAHIAGAVVGLLLGIVVLRNLRVRTWERVVWWICLLTFLGLYLAAIIWNAVDIGLTESNKTKLF